MIYQHWQGNLKLKAKSQFGSTTKNIQGIDFWFPAKTPAGDPPDPANLQHITTDNVQNLEIFANFLHVGGGINKVVFSIVFTGTIEYWQG